MPNFKSGENIVYALYYFVLQPFLDRPTFSARLEIKCNARTAIKIEIAVVFVYNH